MKRNPRYLWFFFFTFSTLSLISSRKIASVYRKLNGFDDKNNLQCSFERCFCESCKFFNRKMSRILIGYAEVSVFSVLFKWQHFNCQTGSILWLSFKHHRNSSKGYTPIDVKNDKVKLAISVFFSLVPNECLSYS